MPLTESNDYKYFGNHEPICPHCDTVYDIPGNESYELYGEEDSVHEVECGNPDCEKEFKVRPFQIWKFSTDNQKDKT